MKVTALALVAISGLAVALPQPAEKEHFHDLTKLKYANSVPVAEVARMSRLANEKRAAGTRTKDNRNLDYSNNVPKAKKDAAFEVKVKQQERYYQAARKAADASS